MPPLLECRAEGSGLEELVGAGELGSNLDCPLHSNAAIG